MITSAMVVEKLAQRGWDVCRPQDHSIPGGFKRVSFIFNCPCGRPILENYQFIDTDCLRINLLDYVVELFDRELKAHVESGK